MASSVTQAFGAAARNAETNHDELSRSKHFVDAEDILLGIEKNGLVPVVVGAIRLLDKARATLDGQRRHGIDVGLGINVEVEKKFHTARIRIVG